MLVPVLMHCLRLMNNNNLLTYLLTSMFTYLFYRVFDWVRCELSLSHARLAADG